MRDDVSSLQRKARYERTSDRRKQGHTVKVSERKCRVCGKDPSPNRFFCKACHYVVSIAFAPDAAGMC